MVTTPSIPKVSSKQKSKELREKKSIQDAVRDVQQILALSDNSQELKEVHQYWKEVLNHLDPDGTISLRRL